MTGWGGVRVVERVGGLDYGRGIGVRHGTGYGTVLQNLARGNSGVVNEDKG